MLQAMEKNTHNPNEVRSQQDAQKALSYLFSITNQYNFLKYPFQQEIVCSSCHRKTILLNEEFMASVVVQSFVKRDRRNNLKYSTKDAIQSHLHGGSEVVHRACPNPNCNSNDASKTIKLITAANFLIIHLKIFENIRKANRILLQKINASSEPFSTIKIKTLSGIAEYKAVSLIEHLDESITSRHYVCHVHQLGRWTTCNDDEISVSNSRLIPTQKAYLILLKKI